MANVGGMVGNSAQYSFRLGVGFCLGLGFPYTVMRMQRLGVYNLGYQYFLLIQWKLLMARGQCLLGHSQ